MAEAGRSRWATLALLPLGALCLVVGGVGAVAVTAELSNTWGSYFVMERTVALATPVATALLLVTGLVGAGVVLRTG